MAGESSDQPPAKRVKYDFTQTFDVLVGPEKKRFTVYHGILTERSGFFKAARSSRWTEDSNTATDLTDHDPEDFTNYLQLIYGGGCIQPDEELTQYVKDGRPEEKLRSAYDSIYAHYGVLFKLRMLADKLEDLKSANLIMDAILIFGHTYSRMLTSTLIKFVYNATPPNSPLRKIVRDTIIYENAGKHFLGGVCGAELPFQLLLDVAKEHHRIKFEQSEPHGSFSNVYNKSLWGLPKCRYHQHNDNHPECK